LKVIFSRKGFDTKYGGGCSPILPDGKLLSIPIPSISIENGIAYSDIISPYGNYNDLMLLLNIKIPENRLAHLDPDIVKSVYKRKKNWRGIFGQSGAASSHLHNCNVENGDIFLFFGSFRKTTFDSQNRICFSESSIRHIIFGYMIVDFIYNIGHSDISIFKANNPHLNWAFYHPHLINEKYGNTNSIYIAKTDFNGLPGYGTFYYNDCLLLTSPNKTKSIWKLPAFFHYDYGTNISRHGNLTRYTKHNRFIELSTVSIGQEFVVSGNPKVYAWALNIIKSSQKYF